MTKRTKENPIIDCSAVLQTGIRAQPRSAVEPDPFHGAGRQMASECLRLNVNVSHVLTGTTTVTLCKYIFQRRVNLEAWWGGKFLELLKHCRGFSRSHLPTDSQDSQLEYSWSELNGSVPSALENALSGEYIVYHKFLHDCPHWYCVFITYLEQLSLITIYRIIITATFTHRQLILGTG